jgi:hypothetical protein
MIRRSFGTPIPKTCANLSIGRRRLATCESLLHKVEDASLGWCWFGCHTKQMYSTSPRCECHQKILTLPGPSKPALTISSAMSCSQAKLFERASKAVARNQRFARRADLLGAVGQDHAVRSVHDAPNQTQGPAVAQHLNRSMRNFGAGESAYPQLVESSEDKDGGRCRI